MITSQPTRNAHPRRAALLFLITFAAVNLTAWSHAMMMVRRHAPPGRPLIVPKATLLPRQWRERCR